MITFMHPDAGRELDWLAIDVDGHIGLFSTGGQGPVPVVVVANMDDVEAAVERLPQLPIIGEVAESPTNGNYEFWADPSRRGLFGYDWGPVPMGPYARLTIPSRPIAINEVQDSLVKATAALVQLPVRFSQAAAIDVSDLGVQLYGS
jgi:hypothetical protein